MKQISLIYTKLSIAARGFYSLIVVTIIVVLIYNFTEIIPSKKWCVFIIGIYAILEIIEIARQLIKTKDKELVKNFRNKNKATHLMMKTKINRRINLIKDVVFKVKEMYLEGKPYVVKIVFTNNLMPDVVPEVYFEKTKISVEVVGSNAILCYLRKTINTKTKNFSLKIGKNEYSFKNPYYIDLEEISKIGNIAWQCEGHTNEKYIYISKICFPYMMKDGQIIFSLFSDNKYIGEFTGTYIPEQHYILIPISSVHKSQCAGKKCILKPYNDDGVKILLPKPEAIFINGRVSSAR